MTVKKQIANLLTCSRILCGFALLCRPVFSIWFHTFYLLGGFTDAIDGTVARKLGITSTFGARLDTVADIVFFGAVILKLAISMVIPAWVIRWIAGTAAIKLLGILIGFIKYRRFITVHSMINKVCGIAVYMAPLYAFGVEHWHMKLLGVSCSCVIAVIAAIHEVICIWQGRAIE